MSEPTPVTPYQDVILSHAKAPKRYGAVSGVPMRQGTNPLCGDEVSFFLTQTEPVDATFESRGCALCRASASILAEATCGRAHAVADRFIQDFLANFANLPVNPKASSELQALLDMRRYATRTRCVLLPWETLGALLADVKTFVEV